MKISKKITIIQKRSIIGATASQKATVAALGLRKIDHCVTHTATPSILGMVRKVQHLVVTTMQ